MGKKQHSKDGMFVTETEWATEWGGAKSKENRTRFKRLPFYRFANIILYIRKYGKNPVTGARLKQEDLIDLAFYKNSEGGLNTLSAMEKAPVDDNDQSLEEIKIISVTIFINPYLEPDEDEDEGKVKGEKTVEDEDNDKVGSQSWYRNSRIWKGVRWWYWKILKG